ncbi:MAG TPA: AI-2E family transporter [Bacteroidales bacterium]|nr:AI-2E family transporter [Bacteroidales bacterium]
MNKTIRYVLYSLGFVLFVFVLWYFRNIVVYVLISAVLSLIGRPVVELLGKLKYKNFHLPNTLSAAITLLFLWTVFFTFFRVFIPLVIQQANQLSTIDVQKLVDSINGPIEWAEGIFNRYNPDSIHSSSLQEYITNKVASLLNLGMITNFFGYVASILGNFVIALFSVTFITFFFLKDEKLFANAIIMLIPTEYEEEMKRALRSVRHLLGRYFIGILVQITCIIILITIGLTIVGLSFKQGLVIGLFVGILNVIPYVGPIAGAVLGISMGVITHLSMDFSSQLLPLMIYMLLVFISVQIIDNVVFQPIIYSSSVHAHPLEIFIVLLVAGSLGGIIGMILAIPGYTVLRVFAKEFFNNFKVVKKLTENI